MVDRKRARDGYLTPVVASSDWRSTPGRASAWSPIWRFYRVIFGRVALNAIQKISSRIMYHHLPSWVHTYDISSFGSTPTHVIRASRENMSPDIWRHVIRESHDEKKCHADMSWGYVMGTYHHDITYHDFMAWYITKTCHEDIMTYHKDMSCHEDVSREYVMRTYLSDMSLSLRHVMTIGLKLSMTMLFI